MSAPVSGVDRGNAGRNRTPNRWGEGQHLRQEILDAAERLLCNAHNPDEVSLRGIAREAGITAGAVYGHFKDKADLMWTLLDSAYDALAEQIRTAHEATSGDDAWDGLRAAVDAYCGLAANAPRQYDLLFRIGPGLPPPENLPCHPMEKLLEAWREVVAPYVTATGRNLDSIDVTAKVLWSGLHGQMGLWRNVSQNAEEKDLEAPRDALLVALFGRC